VKTHPFATAGGLGQATGYAGADLSRVDDRLPRVQSRDELFRLNLGQHTNQVTSTAGLTTKRRDIARILTILRARNLGIEAQASKQATKPAKAEKKSKTEKPAKKTAKKAKS
jgi:ribosomal protein L29